MKPFNNYAETQTITSAQTLPVNAYVIKIMKAECKTYNTSKGVFEKLELCFDIAEGDFKDFYANNYKSQNTEDKKWKGVYRLNIPTDDGSEADGWSKRKFKTDMTAIEESNSGYHWDWNEAQLKGKVVGLVCRSEEWSFNGKTGWRTAPFKFISAADVKSGNFKLPDPKPINGNNKPSTTAVSNNLDAFVEVATGDDLPF